jgi:hypothetical protein
MGLDESLSLLSWTRMGAGMKILEIPVPLLTRAFFLTQDEPVRRLAASTEGLSGGEEKSSTFSPHLTILEEERSRQLRRVLSGG